MVQRHSALRTYTLAEFAAEQRLLRQVKVLNRLREEKLEALKLKVRNVKVSSKSKLTHLPNATVEHGCLLCFS